MSKSAKKLVKRNATIVSHAIRKCFMVNTDSTRKQLTGILVIRAKDGLNNPDGYTHSKAIKFSYTNN